MMAPPRFAVDTSVAVPLLVASHAAHEAVRDWARGRRLHLSGHALPETYAVLTRLPGDARMSCADATALIDDRFFGTLTLPADAAADVHRHVHRLWITCAQHRSRLCTAPNDESASTDMLITLTSLSFIEPSRISECAAFHRPVHTLWKRIGVS